eukprot:TRINITY_DN26368_c0_g1_i1.p1 TRINITY_DN26368_c0_g1~~TRINITY_DN26368_c0_g1_i1.p1  ORF type:complete len:212 (-),score=29.52 TRINITY_DN26368_c0_g1_i1:145-780(-)
MAQAATLPSSRLFTSQTTTGPAREKCSSIFTLQKPGLGKLPCQLRVHSRESPGQSRRFFCRAASTAESGSPDEGKDEDESSGRSEEFRERMNRMMGTNDAAFRGRDLAMLIRQKYGKSYDVQLIRKEFMGRQLLAMNVMWKYREQKSFPLTEEEYMYHLDGIADNLRIWGAVSTVRSSLEKTKERPRIGKAVSIMLDVDDNGGRAREWIAR